jgi:hypothetical protein
MKKFAAIVAIVLGLGLTDVNEASARGHGGRGHGGRGHGHGRVARHRAHRVHARIARHRAGHYHWRAGKHWAGRYHWRVGARWHYRVNRGIYRTTWYRKVWSPVYQRYLYTDPAVAGCYYWSAADQLYFPVQRLKKVNETVLIVNPR